MMFRQAENSILSTNIKIREERLWRLPIILETRKLKRRETLKVQQATLKTELADKFQNIYFFIELKNQREFSVILILTMFFLKKFKMKISVKKLLPACILRFRHHLLRWYQVQNK